MPGNQSAITDLCQLADDTLDLLLLGLDDDANEQLQELSNSLDALEVPDEMRESFARCAHRSVQGVPMWLKATAALCRLVRAQADEPDELISRLTSFLWACGDLEMLPGEALGIDDEYFSRRDVDINYARWGERLFSEPPKRTIGRLAELARVREKLGVIRHR